MALSVTDGPFIVYDGRRRIRYAQITLDNSYNTGGEVITAGQLGLTEIHAVFNSGGDDGYVVQWDQTNLKFVAYAVSTATNTVVAMSQVAASVDLSAVVFYVLVVGR